MVVPLYAFILSTKGTKAHEVEFEQAYFKKQNALITINDEAILSFVCLRALRGYS
jgi:hypothetical protein